MQILTKDNTFHSEHSRFNTFTGHESIKEQWYHALEPICPQDDSIDIRTPRLELLGITMPAPGDKNKEHMVEVTVESGIYTLAKVVFTLHQYADVIDRVQYISTAHEFLIGFRRYYPMPVMVHIHPIPDDSDFQVHVRYMDDDDIKKVIGGL